MKRNDGITDEQQYAAARADLATFPGGLDPLTAWLSGSVWARSHLAAQEPTRKTILDHLGDLDQASAQEPTDAEVRALGRGLNEAGWTCHEGGDNPGFYDECEDCRRVCDDLARAALSAARAARRDEEKRDG